MKFRMEIYIEFILNIRTTQTDWKRRNQQIPLEIELQALEPETSKFVADSIDIFYMKISKYRISESIFNRGSINSIFNSKYCVIYQSSS